MFDRRGLKHVSAWYPESSTLAMSFYSEVRFGVYLDSRLTWDRLSAIRWGLLEVSEVAPASFRVVIRAPYHAKGVWAHQAQVQMTAWSSWTGNKTVPRLSERSHESPLSQVGRKVRLTV